MAADLSCSEKQILAALLQVFTKEINFFNFLWLLAHNVLIVNVINSVVILAFPASRTVKTFFYFLCQVQTLLKIDNVL